MVPAMTKRAYRGSAVELPNIAHPDLVALIKHYCAMTGRGATGVTLEATGDDKLLWDLQGGRVLGTKMRGALLAYMQAKLTEIDDQVNTLEDLINASLARGAR